MASVSYSYRSKKERAYLEVRLSFRLEPNAPSKSVYSRTQIEVKRNIWEDIKKGVKFKDIDKLQEKKRVEESTSDLRLWILNALRDIHVSQITNEWFKKCISNYYDKDIEIPQKVTDYIDYFLSVEKKKKNIHNSYKNLKLLLSNFEIVTKNILYIDTISRADVQGFANYLTDMLYSKNSTKTIVKALLTLLRHASNNDLKVDFRVFNIKLKNEKADIIYLTFEELDKIKQLDNLSKSQEEIRDMLIISCYLGQRYSDLVKFKKEMIRYEDGLPLLEFTQQKTGKIMVVPVHSEVMNILDKRGGEFPKSYSHTHYNNRICEIGKLAGIDTPTDGSLILRTDKGKGWAKTYDVYPKYMLLSSHVGRRSFATNFYGIIPTSYLIYITGHSTEQMFLNYIGKANKDIVKDVFKFFK